MSPSCICIGFLIKSNPALNLPSGEINLVVTNGLISVGIPIIDPPGIGYNLFFAKIYDCPVVFVTISCSNPISFANSVIIVFLPK
ncbi:Uncharacterised protein [Staphylococcus aureus]|nr:Uncharacterised protein [Staphylococcus aureus]